MSSPAEPAPHNPARAYVTGTIVSMLIYGLAIAGASFVEDAAWNTGAVTIAIALAPACAIIAQLLVTLRYMTQADEFVRAVTAKRFVAAASVMMAGVTTWGFLELYATAPRMATFLVYPFFWGAYAVVSPFIRSSQP